ncbi:hypothetical protein EJ06DRAFT_556215 [Trichodelitschia bisporula]|uniref:Uncharacterized protein n=1 Tax=Trichodelitschia bisporula TaxID=703511 RepID=A0A6G1HXX2_9PEZI|nr:hypothetical protein EJ06DRAFT_556215 [Trichodelitschia bisporula]
MKFVPLFSALLAALPAHAVPVAEQAVGEVVEEYTYNAAAEAAEAIDAEKPTTNSNANGVRILPRFETTQPKDGATRSAIAYGTFSVSSSRMLSTVKLAKGPCPKAGCFVTAMQATIRYPDKTEANIDSNAWLHHIALFGQGAGGGSIWACGNERPTLRLNTEYNYGIDFPANYMLMIDLMTEDPKPKSLTLEITYEWVPKSSGYKAATMYWLTIGEPAAKSGVYKFTTQPVKANVGGKLLYSIGHMHDGGTDMRLFISGKEVCRSIMHYNARPGYAPKGSGGMEGMEGMGHGGAGAAPAAGGGHAHGGMAHISDPGACINFGEVPKNSMMTAEAWYDAVKYPLMEHNGKKENLMGNMRVYVGGP